MEVDYSELFMSEFETCDILTFNEPTKSEMMIGSTTIYNTKRFNWFQKIMFKLCFGIDIKDIKEQKKK